MDRAKLSADLLRDEGIRLTPYQDTDGWWTIGIGHLLGPGPRMSAISVHEAYSLLWGDVDSAENLAKECVQGYESLDEVRQRALVNMAFNRGDHMKNSTTITPAINQAVGDKNWAPVEEAILNSQWAKEVGHRAIRLAEMLKTGKDV